MKYVMLICGDPQVWEQSPQAERKKIYDEIFAHVDKWEKRGRYIPGGKELQGPKTARTIRSDNSGGVTVTDGPYLDLKEVIGGFMVIEADSMDEAIETASQWPGIAHGDLVEVRPVMVG